MIDDKTLHIIQLCAEAREAKLSGVELLDADPIELAKKYNGIGPESMPAKLRAKLTDALAMFEPAALIHDLRFDAADGSRLAFNAANIELHNNCLKLARAKYPWWRPIRRIAAENAALIIYEAVASELGWDAYCKACGGEAI